MILGSNTTSVEVNGGGSTGSFSIAMNGKAFKVLSDTLYQNKIGSIVRELSCNAYDAHVMKSNTDVPFEIHLPDTFEPWFSIQDFGVGLSPEDVRSVFTVYFQSTKDNSNDTIGAFGLGAKTPFSYTDQFTVSSVKNNLRTVYNAYITESGVPNITVLFSEETQDQTGVEIKMSVKREDYTKFKDEVKNQLKFFGVKPTILNGTVEFETESEFVVNTSNVKLALSNGYYDKGVYLIQGNVGYPLDMVQIGNKIGSDSFRTLEILKNHKAYIYFNIGEIGVTASREGVEYTASTVANIEAKVAKLHSEISEYVTAELKEETSLWAKASKINNNVLYQTFYKKSDNESFDMNYGNIVFDLSKFTRMTAHSTFDLFEIQRYVSHIKTKSFSESGKGIRPNDSIFIVQDINGKIAERVAMARTRYSSPYSTVYLIKPTTQTGINELFNLIKKTLGDCPRIDLLSSYEIPKVVSDKKYARSKTTSFYNYKGYGNYSVSDLERCTEELSETDIILYDTLHTGQTYFDNNQSQMLTKFNQLAKFHNVPKLIFVRESKIKNVEGSNFVKLSEYLKDQVMFYDTDELRNEYIKQSVRKSIRDTMTYGNWNRRVSRLVDHGVECNLTKFVNVFTNNTYDNDRECAKISNIRTFVDFDDVSKVIDNRSKKLKNKFNKIKNNYPLLKYWNVGTDDEMFVDYVMNTISK